MAAPAPGEVTIWTTSIKTFRAYGGKDPTTSSLFTRKEFEERTASQVQEYIADSSQDWPAKVNGVKISVVEIQGHVPWLPSALQSAFPGFPIEHLHQMVEFNEVDDAILPLGRSAKDFTFFIRYPRVVNTKSPHPTDKENFDSCEIYSTPVAVWIASSTSPSLGGDGPPHKSIPLIVIVCQNPIVRQRLDFHFRDDFPRRLDRLAVSPAWIYMDLDFALSQWQEVWGIAAATILVRNKQLTGRAAAPSFLELTRVLHHDNNSVVMLQEGLRLHISAMEAFRGFVVSHKDEESRRLHSISHTSVVSEFRVVSHDHQNELQNRIEDCLQNLKHTRGTSNVISTQVDILLSLAFNTEMVMQGRSVARLNVLAMAFLPLTFVASLFGMTTFTIRAVWYPLWAFVCLMIVAILACIYRAISRAGHNQTGPQQWMSQQWEMPVIGSRAKEPPVKTRRTSIALFGFRNQYSRDPPMKSKGSHEPNIPTDQEEHECPIDGIIADRDSNLEKRARLLSISKPKVDSRKTRARRAGYAEKLEISDTDEEIREVPNDAYSLTTRWPRSSVSASSYRISAASRIGRRNR